MEESRKKMRDHFISLKPSLLQNPWSLYRLNGNENSYAKRNNRDIKHDVYGKRQDEISFCQNTEKLDLIKLLSCLLTRYVE